MLNNKNGNEFIHDFDEIFNYGVETGKYNIERELYWRNLWNYFSEAKAEEELLALCKASPDRRTKIGKWAAEIRERYDLDFPISYCGKYKSLVNKEIALNKRES